MLELQMDKRRFIALVALLIFSGTLIIVGVRSKIRDQVFEETTENLRAEARFRATVLENEVRNNVRHVEFLHAVPPIEGIIRAAQNNGFDPVEQNSLEIWEQRLESIFQAYIYHNPGIAQIRYIGVENKGRELVRVEKAAEPPARVIAPKNLQSKGHRDYFKHAQQLAPGDIYISDIELNEEWQQIDSPPWLTYRIAKPVVTADGEFFGIVILNFEANRLFDLISKDLGDERKIYLLNSQGFYVMHPGIDLPQVAKKLRWEDDVDVYMNSHPSQLEHISLKSTHDDIRVVKHPVNFFLNSGEARYTLVLGEAEARIKSTIFQRQLTASIIDLALGGVILLLLLFYWMFSRKSRAESQARATFESLVSGSNDGIICMDKAANIQSWNIAAQEQFNASDNSIKQRNLYDFIPREKDKNAIAETICQLVSGESIPTIDIQVSTPQGKLRVYSVTLSPIRLNSSSMTGISAIFHDITKSRELQSSLRKLNKQLALRNAEMEQFIYSVSHDLKSPLVTIAGFAQRIFDAYGNKMDEKNQHRLNRILANAQTMAQLLDELLSLSRIIRQELSMENCSVESCVEQVKENLEQLIESTQASIEIDDSLGPFLANKRLLTQCLQNLIGNAIQYRNPEKMPRIQISAARLSNTACIRVRDNGIGIDTKHHEQIFRIFERLGVGEGSGVGLAIVKTVMDKHKGRIELDSALGQGSCFTMHIPQPEGPANNEST